MLRVVICEDEQGCLTHLAQMVREIFAAGRLNGELLLACADPGELEAFVRTRQANVYLLDIHLREGREGFEAALKIRERQPEAYVVFISENVGLVFESFKMRPFDFLPKPVSPKGLLDLFSTIFRDMQNQARENEERYLTIRSASIDHRVKKDSIIMIEKYGEKAYVYTAGAKLTCYTTLEEFQNLLGDLPSIIRCHKSYLVNLNHITQRDSSRMKLTLEGGLVAYVSRTYRKRVFS